MPRSSHSTKTLTLSLILLCAACTDSGSAQAGTREAMADAMAKMMEAMGMLDNGPATSAPMAPPFGPSGWTPGFGSFGMPGTSPWNMPFQDPSGAMSKGGEMMNQFSQRMPIPGDYTGKQGFPWIPTRLDGVWEGRSGELLIVQGNRFRIYPGTAGFVDGYIQTRGDRLAMYSPADDSARPFEFAESEGRLVLRDVAGQLFLYRRLWLDETQSGTDTASAPKR